MNPRFIKTPEQTRLIEEGGKILNEILQATAIRAQPGVSTLELSEFAEKEINKMGGRPSFIGYGDKQNPYPAALCTSVNDVVVHGIPNKQTILREGDILGLDIGMEYKKMYTDTAITIPIGNIDPRPEKLIEITRQCLIEAIAQAKVGNRIGDISYAIQNLAEKNGFSVVRDLVGHGVGFAVHEEPAVPCYGKRGTGLKLEAGLVIAIEPMLCEKDWPVVLDPDGWTIVTADGGLAAHFEHTIAITENGPRVLT